MIDIRKFFHPIAARIPKTAENADDSAHVALLTKENAPIHGRKHKLSAAIIHFNSIRRYPLHSDRRRIYRTKKFNELAAARQALRSMTPIPLVLHLASVWRHPFNLIKQKRFLLTRLKTVSRSALDRDIALPVADAIGPTVIPAPPLDRYIALPLGDATGPAAIPRIGVMLHCFYVDVLGEIVDALGNIPWPFHVIVTTDLESKRAPIEAELNRLARASGEIVVTRNRGRDIAPRLVALRDHYDAFDLVLHLHTKKSEHNASLEGWLSLILGDLLGSPDVVRSVAALFETDPKLGILAPRHFGAIRPYINWTNNLDRCAAYARRLGVRLEADSSIDFPSGSMFWLRPAALQPLLSIGFRYEDFEPERGQQDGTLAHAIERLVFFSAEAAGMGWRFVGAGAPERAGEEAVHASASERLDELLRRTERRLILPLDKDPKRDFRARCAIRLSAHLEAGQTIALPTSETPVVSIILVSYNAAELTFEHLMKLKRALDVPCEIIIVDNASGDRTQELLSRVTGARVIYNGENVHFLRAVNQGAALACGEMLLLINNDTCVPPGAIGKAVEILRSDASIGAVGGKIVLLDGTLQEAGSIIFDDGGCLGYGRGRHPSLPEFNFQRDVDYCSGAFMMMPRALFEAMGRLDDAFAPAYYEETDLSMRLRAAGYRIIYEPRIEISHYEFGSSVSSEAALALQAHNLKLFRERHAQALLRFHYPHSAPPALVRDASPSRRILFIDDRIPNPALGAGYPRAAKLLRAIVNQGWSVTFYPLLFPKEDLTFAYEVFSSRIEFMIGYGQERLTTFLRERKGCYDAVLVSRPPNMDTLHKAFKTVPDFLVNCTLIYDAEAIFAEREAVRRFVKGEFIAHQDRQKAISEELALANGAAVVIAVSAREQALFEEELGRRQNAPRIVRLGHALKPEPTQNRFEQRSNLLFVGRLNGSCETSPNIDSLIWFVREVMPKLDRLVGESYRLTVVGRIESSEVEALAGPRVELLGMMPHLRPLYDASRVFVAPTRFASGIPHKVHEAAASGVPCVVTPLLAAQLGWRDGAQVLVGESAGAFAQACAHLLQDGELWDRIREGALAQLARDCDPDKFEAAVQQILAQVEVHDPVRRRRAERRLVSPSPSVGAGYGEMQAKLTNAV